LAHIICNKAILVDGYISAEPFFATSLGAVNIKVMKVY
jgi:hypothetical protein